MAKKQPLKTGAAKLTRKQVQKGQDKGHATQSVTKLRRQQAFIRAFMICGTVSGASAASGVNHNSHKEWHANDDSYRETFHDAREAVADMLESEAIRRATQGVQRVVLYKGKPVKIGKKTLVETTFSDTLLIFLLKGHRPDKFRDRMEIGVDDGSIDAAINAELAKFACNSQAAASQQAEGKKRGTTKKDK